MTLHFRITSNEIELFGRERKQEGILILIILRLTLFVNTTIILRFVRDVHSVMIFTFPICIISFSLYAFQSKFEIIYVFIDFTHVHAGFELEPGFLLISGIMISI